MEQAKLTDEKMKEYRARRNAGESVRTLAKEAGVHVTSMYARLRGVSKNAYHKGGSKIKRAKRAKRMKSVEIPLIASTPQKVDRVVVMLVDPAQLSKVLGDLHGRN